MKKFVNGLTLTRILATFILPIIWRKCSPTAILIFVTLILFTDFFDGFLARRYHVQSLFGSITDTIADKMFGIVILFVIATYHPLYYFLVVFECGIALVNLGAALKGATTKSTFLGKFKMWLLGISILFGIIDIFGIYKINYIFQIVSKYIEYKDMILISSIFITCGSELMVIIDYSRHIIKELKQKKPEVNYELKTKKELSKVLFNTEFYLKHKNEPLYTLLLK